MGGKQPRSEKRAGRDFAVGYCKPPVHTRFQPGQSGNPRGRAKEQLTFQGLIKKVLAEKVSVKEGGRRRRMTKAEAIATQLVNKAAAGADLRAIKTLLNLEASCYAGPESYPSCLPEQTLSAGCDTFMSTLERLTTEQLEIVYKAALILEGEQERPPVPLPPV